MRTTEQEKRATLRDHLLYDYAVCMLISEYKEAARILAEKKAEVKLAKVDATTEMELTKKMGIQGFPTLKYFKLGKIPRDYAGERKAKVRTLTVDPDSASR